MSRKVGLALVVPGNNSAEPAMARCFGQRHIGRPFRAPIVFRMIYNPPALDGGSHATRFACCIDAGGAFFRRTRRTRLSLVRLRRSPRLSRRMHVFDARAVPRLSIRAVEHLLRYKPARKVQTACAAAGALIMIRALPFLLVVWIATAAPTPVAAQRFAGNYPVCLQKWEWGGASSIRCQYSSWEECKASAAGLSATCLLNPYVPQPPQPGRSPRPR